MLDGLPNCVFDASGPLRQYTHQARLGSFFAKAAELSAVGAVTGAATSLACSAAVEVHKKMDPSYEPSTSVPSVGRSSGGLATFFATSANIRYASVLGQCSAAQVMGAVVQGMQVVVCCCYALGNCFPALT